MGSLFRSVEYNAPYLATGSGTRVIIRVFAARPPGLLYFRVLGEGDHLYRSTGSAPGLA